MVDNCIDPRALATLTRNEGRTNNTFTAPATLFIYNAHKGYVDTVDQ